MTALAGLVPCAEAGISTTSRKASFRLSMVFADHQQPGNSPCGARIGLVGYFVESGHRFQEQRQLMEQLAVSLRPGRAAQTGARCRIRASSGVAVSRAAFSFMVHEPRGIIPCGEGKVFPLELVNVPHEFRLAPVPPEQLQVHEMIFPGQPSSKGKFCWFIDRRSCRDSASAEANLRSTRPHRPPWWSRRGLMPIGPAVKVAEVDAARSMALMRIVVRRCPQEA